MRPLSIVLWPAMVALLLQTLAAQPTIRQVVNAASEIPPPLPGSWLAQGARFLIRGKNLGPGTVVTSETPLPSLGGVSVRIAHRGTEWNAPLIEVGPTQIEAIMPGEAPAGDITVGVIHHGVASRPARARLAQQTLGLYSSLKRSYGPAVEGPVSRGDRVTLHGTGLGPKPKPGAIEIFVASRKAPVLRAAPSESEPGIDEIEIRIPPDAPTGCSVPVQARLLGRIPSNTVTLSIEANRDDCPALMDAQQALASGGATGYALLTRLAPEVLAGDNSIFRFAAEHLSTRISDLTVAC